MGTKLNQSIYGTGATILQIKNQLIAYVIEFQHKRLSLRDHHADV